MLAVSDAGSRFNFVELSVPLWAWAALAAALAVLLAADLVRHRNDHEPSPREAATETAIWIGFGLAFSIAVLVGFGSQAFGEYISGYLIEKSLSVDNVFVWAIPVLGHEDPAEVPAPGAVLGHLRRPRPASDLHPGRDGADQSVLLVADRLRRLPRLHRGQDHPAPQRDRTGAGGPARPLTRPSALGSTAEASSGGSPGSAVRRLGQNILVARSVHLDRPGRWRMASAAGM
jgi:hypothetical protein